MNLDSRAKRRRPRGRTPRRHVRRAGALGALPPPRRTRLGHVESGSIAPAVVGLVELGVLTRPELAGQVRGRVELRTQEPHPWVSVTFSESEIVVEDVPHISSSDPDLVVEGSLPDVLQLTTTPLVAGVPDLRDSRDRTALAAVAEGQVKFRGRIALVRQLIRLLQIQQRDRE